MGQVEFSKMIIVFITSLFVRILSIFLMPVLIAGDAKVYDELGRSILKWGGLSMEMLKNFPLKDHPLYPLFIAANYYLFGQNHFFVWLTQSLIGALLCVLIYLISREFFNRRVSLMAGFIGAGYPVFVKLSNTMLSEGLFVFIFTLSFFFAVKYLKTAKKRYLVFCGLYLGVSVLVRSVAILFVFLLSGYFFWRNRKHFSWKVNSVRQCLFILVFIFTVLPWSVRNYYKSGGQIIPVTEAPDRGLYNSFHPYKGKIFGIRPDDDPVMVEARGISSLEQRRSFFLSKTIEFIRNNPGKTMKIEILKFAYLWSPFDWEILGNGYACYNFGFVFLVPFFILGLVYILRSSTEQFILLLPVIYFQFIHLIYFALPRFRIGFEPILIVISAYGIYRKYDKAKNKHNFILLVSAFLIINILFFLYSFQIKLFFREICRLIGLW